MTTDQLCCLDCGATLERLTRAQALATMRRRLKTREQLKPTTEADA